MSTPPRQSGLRRALADRWRRATATITRTTATGDGITAPVTTTDITFTVPVWLAPLRDAQEIAALAGQLQGRAPYRVNLPTGTDIRAEDQIVVTGNTLVVIGPAGRPWGDGVSVVAALVEPNAQAGAYSDGGI